METYELYALAGYVACGFIFRATLPHCNQFFYGLYILTFPLHWLLFNHWFHRKLKHWFTPDGKGWNKWFQPDGKGWTIFGGGK